MPRIDLTQPVQAGAELDSGDRTVADAGDVPFRLSWDGAELELVARRAGWRTKVELRRDGDLVGTAVGGGRVLLPLPVPVGAPPRAEAEPEPTVLVLTALPGVVNRAFLLVPRAPREDGGREAPLADVLEALPSGVAKSLGRLAGAERLAFDPPAGSLAARLAAFGARHPRLWAARHVASAAARVVLGVLGVTLLVQLLVERVLDWVLDQLPSIPWPDVDLPSIPWPDLDWPDVTPPAWFEDVLATMSYWGPVLVAVGVAVTEVRRRRRAARSADGAPGETPPDANRRA